MKEFAKFFFPLWKQSMSQIHTDTDTHTQANTHRHKYTHTHPMGKDGSFENRIYMGDEKNGFENGEGWIYIEDFKQGGDMCYL